MKAKRDDHWAVPRSTGIVAILLSPRNVEVSRLRLIWHSGWESMETTLTQILLTDDNDANRLIARTILERSGYAVTTAHNGAETLGLAKIIAFDLIVLDIMMPVMDGMRALRHLRRDKNLNQNTTVFALTAFCSAEDQQRYLLAGFDYVLAKPLRPGDMEKALSHYKNRKTMPVSANLDELSPLSIKLIDKEMTHQISAIADKVRLDAIQSRFWRSITEQCSIIEKSLPDAILIFRGVCKMPRPPKFQAL